MRVIRVAHGLEAGVMPLNRELTGAALGGGLGLRFPPPALQPEPGHGWPVEVTVTGSCVASGR